jgi:hypothetical protein
MSPPARRRQRGSPIPRSLRERLSRYFPDLDLDAVRLHAGLPRYVRGGFRGYASRDRVYLAAAWREDDVELLALLAHELVHVRQYRQLGPWRFRWAYLREYLAGRVRRLGHLDAYRNISFERAARELEARVRREHGNPRVQA